MKFFKSIGKVFGIGGGIFGLGNLFRVVPTIAAGAFGGPWAAAAVGGATSAATGRNPWIGALTGGFGAHLGGTYLPTHVGVSQVAGRALGAFSGANIGRNMQQQMAAQGIQTPPPPLQSVQQLEIQSRREADDMFDQHGVYNTAATPFQNKIKSPYKELIRKHNFGPNINLYRPKESEYYRPTVYDVRRRNR